MGNRDRLLGQLNIDLNLLIDFFMHFSRLEFALKCIPAYLKGDEGNASADWGKFASNLEGRFDQNMNPELQEAVKYLLSHIPQKQVVLNGRLCWKTPTVSDKLPDIINLINIVRNNLFHGGKFQAGPVQDPLRDTNLLKSCLIILQECLNLEDRVNKKFFESI